MVEQAFALALLAATPNATTQPGKLQNILNFAGVTVGAVLACHTLYKEYGISARRMRQIEIAKARLTAWEARARLESTAVSGEELESSKRLTKEAIDRIWADTNNNLATLASWAGWPIPLIGLPRWRRALLLYRPLRVPGMSRTETLAGYVLRASYFLFVFLSLACIAPVGWLAYLYRYESLKNQQIDRAWFLSHREHILELQMCLDFGIFVWGAVAMRRSVRQEKLPMRAVEVEKL